MRIAVLEEGLDAQLALLQVAHRERVRVVAARLQALGGELRLVEQLAHHALVEEPVGLLLLGFNLLLPLLLLLRLLLYFFWGHCLCLLLVVFFSLLLLLFGWQRRRRRLRRRWNELRFVVGGGGCGQLAEESRLASVAVVVVVVVVVAVGRGGVQLASSTLVEQYVLGIEVSEEGAALAHLAHVVNVARECLDAARLGQQREVGAHELVYVGVRGARGLEHLGGLLVEVEQRQLLHVEAEGDELDEELVLVEEAADEQAHGEVDGLEVLRPVVDQKETLVEVGEELAAVLAHELLVLARRCRVLDALVQIQLAQVGRLGTGR